MGLYFIFLRPALLPEDIRHMNLDAQVLQATVPGLSAWLGKVFTVMGGFMAGTGVLVAYCGSGDASAPTGLLDDSCFNGCADARPDERGNFALHSDFR